MIPNDRLPVLRDLLNQALKALEADDEKAVITTLTAVYEVIGRKISGVPVPASPACPLNEAISLLEQVLSDPSPPDISASLQSNQALVQFYSKILKLREFFLALVQGDLSRELRMPGYVAGALKAHQANLRHLTWQTQMIASGDFSQRVDYMGEFSAAFNAMVIRLDESLHQIKEKEAELTRINMELRQEVELRKKTEESLRKSEERYHQLAITDPLTGIYNRRYFFELAKRELRRTWRYSHPLAIVMLDIDHFKKINDSYGHVIGDQVLQTVASLVSDSLRVIDTFARYGGEEFIILLPETTLEAASSTAERLCRQVAGTPLFLKKIPLHLTVSIGISCFNPAEKHPSGTLDHLIGLADKALYEAKKTGRNRVCICNGNA